MFGRRNADEELPYTVCAFERLPVPRQSGIGAIEVREVIHACGRVVCGVVEAREVVRRASSNFNAAGDGLEMWPSDAWNHVAYSFCVSVLMFRIGFGVPSSD